MMNSSDNLSERRARGQRKTTTLDQKVGPPYSRVKFKEETPIVARTQEEKRIDVENAVLFVRRSEWVQSERMQVYADAAMLAAEQIQDKRLEFHEQGPEVTTEDILFDFFLTFAAAAPFAGPVLAAITRRTLAPVLRTSSVLSVVAKQGLRTLPAVLAKGAAAEAAMRAIEKSLLGLGGFTRAFFKGDSAGEEILSAIAQAWEDVRDQKVKPAPVLSKADSPGVQIGAAARKFASQQRFAIRQLHAVLEAAVRADLLEMAEVADLLKWETEIKDEEAAQLGMADLQDAYRRLFEAIIWVKLFGFETGVPRIFISGFSPVAHLKDVPEPVLRYWLERFINPHTGKLFAAAGLLRGVSDLHQYFLEIGKKYRSLEEIEHGKGITVATPPILNP